MSASERIEIVRGRRLGACGSLSTRRGWRQQTVLCIRAETIAALRIHIGACRFTATTRRGVRSRLPQPLTCPTAAAAALPRHEPQAGRRRRRALAPAVAARGLRQAKVLQTAGLPKRAWCPEGSSLLLRRTCMQYMPVPRTDALCPGTLVLNCPSPRTPTPFLPARGPAFLPVWRQRGHRFSPSSPVCSPVSPWPLPAAACG